MAKTNFGDLLRKRREERKKSMGEVARHIGTSVAYLADVEHGRRKPLRPDLIESVAAFLGIDAMPLLLAATMERGGVELTLKTERPKAAEVGAALAREWADFNDEFLEELKTLVANRKRG